jgi:O-methyltransferase domain
MFSYDPMRRAGLAPEPPGEYWISENQLTEEERPKMSNPQATASKPDAPPPAAQLFNLAMSHFAARCLHTVSVAGVADYVTDTPQSATAIAAAAGVNADALQRMLRLLAMNGVFQFSEGGWSHTPLSLLLRKDHPQSMHAFAAMMGDGVNWASLGAMSHTLATGEPAARQVHPGGIWGYYAEHQDLARQFDAAMTAKSHGDIGLLLATLDMAGVSEVADIAGGRGHFLSTILDAHPQVSNKQWKIRRAEAEGDRPRGCCRTNKQRAPAANRSSVWKRRSAILQMVPEEIIYDDRAIQRRKIEDGQPRILLRFSVGLAALRKTLVEDATPVRTREREFLCLIVRAPHN